MKFRVLAQSGNVIYFCMKFGSVEERRAYWRNWYHKNKNRSDYKEKSASTKTRIRKDRSIWWSEFKKTLKCLKCGDDDFRVLDLHHLDSSQKDIEVSNMVQKSYSKERILKEVAKCICLCACCHRIVHWEQKYGDKV